jgi:hypothetical protein
MHPVVCRNDILGFPSTHFFFILYLLDVLVRSDHHQAITINESVPSFY